jgi:Uma2 family endonuclease
MSTAAPSAQPVTYGLDASIPRFSVAKYQRMIEAGILTPDDKVELLENCVVLKMPKNPLHDGTLDIIKAVLPGLLPPGWLLRVQQTIVLSDSQPEPDFAIVRGMPRSFLTRHPGPAEIGIVIEVADSSLLRDQRDKTRIYARAGLPVYWIVNLVDRRVEVYSQPSGPTAAPAYGAFQTYQPGDAVPLTLDGTVAATVPAADLLP